jgi:DNA repair protein RadD
MILRNYQTECVNAVSHETRKALVVMPCGSGKTECFIEILKNSLDKKNLVVLDQLHLFDQTERRILEALPQIAIRQFSAGREKQYHHSPITIATLQTISKVKNEIFDQIILDEVHLMDFKKEASAYKKIIDQNPQAKIIGFTATPYRTNQGYIYGEDQFFPEITFKKDLIEMIEEGYLVPPVLKGAESAFDLSGVRVRGGEWDQKDISRLVSNREKNIKQVTEALRRSADRKKIIWFCASIEHAEAVRNEIIQHGERATILHSKMSEEDQAYLKRSFEESDIRHLVFVTIVSKGYDYPPIDCVVILRPTKSPSLYVQVCGRALRPSPGKKDALILDFGRVVETLGPMNDPLVTKKGESVNASPAQQMMQCSFCLSIIPLSSYYCEECGEQLKETKKDQAPTLTQKPDTEAILIGTHVKIPSGLKKATVEKVHAIRKISSKGYKCVHIHYFNGGKQIGFEPLVLETIYFEKFTKPKLLAIFESKSRVDVFLERMSHVNNLDIYSYETRKEFLFKQQKYGLDLVSIDGKFVFGNARGAN